MPRAKAGLKPRPGRAREGLCECHDKARNSLHALSREVLWEVLCTSVGWEWSANPFQIPPRVLSCAVTESRCCPGVN